MNKTRDSVMTKVFPNKEINNIQDTSIYLVDNKDFYVINTEKEAQQTALTVIYNFLYSLDPSILEFYSYLGEKSIKLIQTFNDSTVANNELYDTLNHDEFIDYVFKYRSISSIIACDGKEITSGKYKIYKINLSPGDLE